MKNLIGFVAPFLLVVSTIATAEVFELGQENKKFTKSEMTIKVGDSVKFINNDDFFHNVFSLSDSITFDLGSFPKGQSKTVVFEEAGLVEVECAIHPDMFMEITVQ